MLKYRFGMKEHVKARADATSCINDRLNASMVVRQHACGFTIAEGERIYSSWDSSVTVMDRR